MQNPFDNNEGKAAIARRLKPPADDATVQDYIEDAWAKAKGIAPCISKDSFPEEKEPELKAILRGIILRWHDAQAGGATGKSQMAGPYQQNIQLDQRPRRGYQLQPSDEIDLQRLCQRKGRAFSFGTMPEEGDSTVPLYGVVINGTTEGLHGPPGEWSPDRPELDI